ncbi:MAG: TonB family protein [Betaproteobacteria bacterium]
MPRRATPPKPADPSVEPVAAPKAAAPVDKRPRGAPATKKAVAQRVTKAASGAANATPAAAAAGPVRKPAARRVVKAAPGAASPPAVPQPELAQAVPMAPMPFPPALLQPARRDRLLAYAIVGSVLIHLVLLTLHFKPFDLKALSDKGPPLEVALVNAKTLAKPTKADILAQANLDGGGNTDADRRAKTPLPVLPKNSPDSSIAVATQKVEALEKQTKELLTQLQAKPAVASIQKPSEAPEKTELPTANELMQRTLEAMRLEAQIAKDMDEYQKRPKRRFIGARAEEYRFARYVEDWRLKIERVGNLNYPEAARQQRIYGSLLLTVSIRSDGTLENVEINRTSGNRLLDAAAVKIVEMSGPFAVFPPDIKRDTDILHITRTWTFTKSDSLVAN